MPAAAIGWVTALTATVLPERNPYPQLYLSLSALLDAICNAASARDWLRALIGYEALLMRELGYGGTPPPQQANLDQLLDIFARQGPRLERYLLGDQPSDVMGSREILRERLRRMV